MSRPSYSLPPGWVAISTPGTDRCPRCGGRVVLAQHDSGAVRAMPLHNPDCPIRPVAEPTPPGPGLWAAVRAAFRGSDT